MKTIHKLFLLLSIFFLTACDRVTAGHVGILVHQLGGDKGVDNEEIGVGRVWVGMIEELHVFPTFQQNYSWACVQKTGAGSPADSTRTCEGPDESISFQTKEGMEVNADVGISYTLQPDKISNIFQTYRRGVEEITDVFLRNQVRDAFNAQGSSLPVESVYGEGKTQLMESVQQAVRAKVGPIGITVDQIYLIGSFRLPKTVVAALNASQEATQRARQRENEVAESVAAANKQVAEAKGHADSSKLKADADAYNTLARAKAEAEANLIVARSVTRELIDYNNVQRWNGQLPTTVLGNGSNVLLSR
jgi:regulator of protease activity HflC (stomatin/prohibitin superfamily)